MSTPAHSLRLILALIFTAAAIPKILDPAAFTQSVAGYQLLPDALVRFTVLTLPWLEVLLAILLVCQVCTGCSPSFWPRWEAPICADSMWTVAASVPRRPPA